VQPESPQPPPSPVDASYPPAVRLHSNRDYGRVFHRQQKAAGRTLVLLLNPRSRRSGGAARLGVMISAKAVKTAVRRHQLKRWVRELFRLQLKTALAGFDAVVLFRSDPKADHPALDAELLALVPKAIAAQATPGQRGGRR
jgi:ribonuclease P protein component